jgi:hypothetical protein
MQCICRLPKNAVLVFHAFSGALFSQTTLYWDTNGTNGHGKKEKDNSRAGMGFREVETRGGARRTIHRQMRCSMLLYSIAR